MQPDLRALARAPQGSLLLLLAVAGAAHALPRINPSVPSWLAFGGQASAHFGDAAVTAGDLNADGYSDLIVNAPDAISGGGGQGRVSIYLGSSSGLAATPVAVREGVGPTDAFGRGIVCLGDVNGDGFQDVAIGVPLAGSPQVGQVQVYHGTAGGIGATPAVVITGNASGAQFGHALAGCDVNGDGFADLIVSAPGYSNGQSSEGRVQLFLGSASGISTTVTWSFEPNVVAALAGAALSSAGDVNADGRDDVLIGAPHFSNGQTAEGAAYLFLGTASGLAATASWTVEGGSTNVLFGDALANAGDVNGDGFADVLVSAPNMSAPEAGEGRVNLYLGSSSGLAATPVRSYEGNQAAAGFGRSVGTAGDVNGDGLADFLIGSPGMNGNVPGEGKAFLFLGSSVSLPFAAQLSFESSQSSPEFGGAVATAGDVNGDGFSDLAVGATKFDGAATDDGAVFVYHGAGAATSTVQFWQLSGSGNANLGAAVEMVGDVNGDGFDDAMIGVPFDDPTHQSLGEALLFLGSATGLAETPSVTVTSGLASSASSGFGTEVRRAGDVNGDGFDDVLIGAPLYDPNANESPEGAAQLWLGSLSGLSLLHTWIGGEGERYGSALASADVNGDGYSDVILGIPDEGRVGATPGPGRVRVYNGSPTGPDLIADWSEDGPNGSLEFGRAVARAGDVNGDGIDDVLISQGEKPGATFERHGHVSLYFGGEFGLAATPHWTRTGDVVGQQFGSSLTSIGDVNADGFADVAIGSTSTSTGAGNGRVDVYLGNVSGFGAAAVRTWIGGSNNLKLGASIASAGDVNGDGFSDLVIGVPSSNVLGTAGSAFIHLGDGSGLGGNPEVIVTASEPKDSFGEAVAGAGDFNGDGFADLLVGAQFAGPDGSSHGAAYAYYGNEAAGLSREFAQLRSDNAHLALGGGSTTSGTSFRMHSLLRSAAGRTRVRHELETRTVGEAWGGITTSSNLLDTGAVLDETGSARSHTMSVTLLTPGTSIHWRLRHSSEDPFFPHSPWIRLQGHSPYEPFLRMRAVTSDVALIEKPAQLTAQPNPMTDTCTLRFASSGLGAPEVAIYDLGGRLVRRLGARKSNQVAVSQTWDGRDAAGRPVANGVYFAEAVGVEGRSVARVVLAR